MDPRRPQRLAAVTAGLCFGLFSANGGIAATPPAPPATAPATASTSITPAANIPTGEPAAGDAAAKHAKRTACLKDAKSKKLVGAEKNAFVKNCIAVP
jgi:psiF repeat